MSNTGGGNALKEIKSERVPGRGGIGQIENGESTSGNSKITSKEKKLKNTTCKITTITKCTKIIAII